MRMTADQIRQHDKIMIDRAWWVVQSAGPPERGCPPEDGWVQMLITREGARQKLRLRLGQQWTVSRVPRGKPARRRR